MEKRWWQYERRPRSHSYLVGAVLFIVFATVQFANGNPGLAAASGAVCVVNLAYFLWERRKERAGQGSLA